MKELDHPQHTEEEKRSLRGRADAVFIWANAGVDICMLSHFGKFWCFHSPKTEETIVMVLLALFFLKIQVCIESIKLLLNAHLWGGNEDSSCIQKFRKTYSWNPASQDSCSFIFILTHLWASHWKLKAWGYNENLGFQASKIPHIFFLLNSPLEEI